MSDQWIIEFIKQFYLFFTTSLANSLRQDHSCSILFYVYMILRLLFNHIYGLKTSRCGIMGTYMYIYYVNL